MLDVSKGAGPDGLPAAIIRELSHELLTPVFEIFARSLREGSFPFYWKISQIIPIFKDGDRRNIENHRGISIISLLPKLFEKIVYDTIFSDVCSQIIPQQHGFMTGRSVNTNLAPFLSDVLERMEDGCQVDVVYADLSKAFDRLHHGVTIEKLRVLGMGGSLLTWFSNYLVGRMQYVLFNGQRSRLASVLSGIPQGSHLGPIIFILFFNDVYTVLEGILFAIYADDIKMYLSIRSLNDCIFFQRKLNDFHQWCVNNGLVINLPKCKAISFSRKLTNINFNYNFGNMTIPKGEVVNDLGVKLDSKLYFNAHYDFIVSKAMRMLGFVKRFGREFKDVHVFKVLYMSHVRPILEFSTPIWSPSYQIHIDRIERVQRNFSKFALRCLDWNDYNNIPGYIDRCRILEIHELSKRRVMFDAMMIFDTFSGKIDSNELLSRLNLNVRSYNTRSYSLLHIKTHRTNYGKNNPIERSVLNFLKYESNFDFNMSREVFKRSIVGRFDLT
jgi:Reverse transcriptase (RNA-dependent DNA polymerase)